MNKNGHLTPYMYLSWILPAKQRTVVNSLPILSVCSKEQITWLLMRCHTNCDNSTSLYGCHTNCDNSTSLYV